MRFTRVNLFKRNHIERSFLIGLDGRATSIAMVMNRLVNGMIRDRSVIVKGLNWISFT